MIKEELEQAGFSLSQLGSSFILVGVSLVLIPVVLIRQFNRIKVRPLIV